MINNMGNTDRITRVLVAMAIAALLITGHITNTLSVILLAIAGISILTGLIGFCPLYYLFKITTVKK